MHTGDVVRFGVDPLVKIGPSCHIGKACEKKTWIVDLHPLFAKVKVLPDNRHLLTLVSGSGLVKAEGVRIGLQAVRLRRENRIREGNKSLLFMDFLRLLYEENRNHQDALLYFLIDIERILWVDFLRDILFSLLLFVQNL